MCEATQTHNALLLLHVTGLRGVRGVVLGRRGLVMAIFTRGLPLSRRW